MRYGDKTLRFQRTVPVRLTLSDGGVITVMAATLPFGVEREIEEEIPTPSPPMRFVKEGGSTRTMPMPDHPEYRRQAAEAGLLQAVALLVRALSADPSFQLDTRREDHPSPLAYWRAVFAELRESGITSAQVMHASSLIGQAAKEELARLEEVGTEVFMRAGIPSGSPPRDTCATQPASDGGSSPGSSSS